MRKKSDFIRESVAYGLCFEEFSHLSKSDRKKLLKLMANISEKSYLRGARHGGLPYVVIRPLRSNRERIRRLLMEYSVLRHIGFGWWTDGR